MQQNYGVFQCSIAQGSQRATCLQERINFVYRSLTQVNVQLARSVGHVTPTWRRNIRAVMTSPLQAYVSCCSSCKTTACANCIVAVGGLHAIFCSPIYKLIGEYQSKWMAIHKICFILHYNWNSRIPPKAILYNSQYLHSTKNETTKAYR